MPGSSPTLGARPRGAITHRWKPEGKSPDPLALAGIARTLDVATARWVARTMQWPTTGLRLSGPAWPWALTLRLILIAAAAIGAVLGIQLLRRRGGDHARAP